VTLHPRQQQELANYRARWDPASAPARANRKAAEAGIELAYRAAGLAPPVAVRWCDGPLELGRQLAEEHRAPSAGGPVKPILVDAVKSAASSTLQTKMTPPLRDYVARGLGLTPPNPLNRAITEHVMAGVASEYGRTYSRMRGIIDRLIGAGAVRWTMPDDFRDHSVSRYSAPWLAFFEFVRDVGPAAGDDSLLDGLCKAVGNAGWIVPFERVCWVTEPPTIVSTERLNRLHSRTGPALAFADGWTLYAWKGVRVPDRIIREADSITAEDISRQWDPIIRRCMLEIFTPERFIREGHAERAGVDETGTLWRKRWFEGDMWAAVEVENGTPEPDGSFKHYFLQVPPAVRTPCEAVAWTYGLTEREYLALRHRT
jgi:hypothetical protein